jgi:hypothetical protein
MRWLWLLIPVVLFACGSKPSAPPKKPVKELTLKISLNDTIVGALHIKPGEFGDFTPADTEPGRAFVTLWEEQKKLGSIAGSESMHLPTQDGSRGPLAARLYRPADPDFVDGVRAFLKDKGYTVKNVANGNIAAATRPSKPESDTSYEVYKNGVKVAAIYIKPGEFGTFTAEANPEAEALRALWEKAREEKMIKIRFQLPEKDGKKGASGSRIFRPEKRGFAKGVELFLLDNGFQVKELPTSQSTSQSASQSASQPASQSTSKPTPSPK